MAYYRCGGQGSSGDAVAADVLLNKTFSNDDDVDIVGTMPNNGKVTPAGLNCGGSYTIPAGYHNGQGIVTANSLASQTTVDSGKTAVGAGQMVSGYQGWVNGNKISGTFTGQEKTVTSSRSAQTVTPDSGKYLTKVTVNALAPTGTYTPTTRAANIDMGATSNYRYVTTTSVPNTNSGTYTFPANDTGGTKDLGDTNTYRYVNASNVYAKGKADGKGTETLLWTNSSPTSAYTAGTITVANYSTYDYIKVEYRISTTDAATSIVTFKIEKTDFVNTWSRTSGAIGVRYDANTESMRCILTNQDYIKIYMSDSTYGGAGYCIPTKIYAVKY